MSRGLATAMRQQDDGTREGLRELRQHLVNERRRRRHQEEHGLGAPPPPKVTLPELMQSRRPAYAVAYVIDGNVPQALRELKKALNDNGTTVLLKRGSRLHEAMSPGRRRRAKRVAARKRAVKALARRRRRGEVITE